MESQSTAAGTLIAGRYRVIRSLARGGMGEVVHCVDMSRGRDVALKQLHTAGDGEIDQLFLREATALASLDHPNLARALDFGFTEGQGRYLVMDFVEGLSLAQIIEQHSVLPWDLLATIADQLLAGLAYLHARGIVHRDIKPANLMLGNTDEALRVTIVDLGLAAFRDHALIELGGQKPELLANVGRYATPPYCAPEQLLRHPMFQGPTTDLHAVGVTLYLLCHGRLPYAGADEAALITALLRKPPAPFVPVNAAPMEVGPIVRRLVAKKPWDRYDFAVTVRQELAPLWSYDAGLSAWRTLRRGLKSAVAPVKRAQPVEPATGRSSLSVSELLTLRVAHLYGRAGEQRRLWEAATAVTSGETRLIALEGEAGVGKSRLAQWLAEQVHERGLMRALHISCGPGGGALQGVLGAIERHFGFGEAPRALVERALVGRWGRENEATRLARALAGILRPEDLEEEQRGAHSAHQQSVLAEPGSDEVRAQTILEVVQRIAGDRPLLLWIDDLPRADDETLTLIRLLLEAQQNALVLLTGRTQQLAAEAESGAPTILQRYCQEHGGELIALSPLARSELKEMLRALLRSDDDVDGKGVEEVLYRA
ncbi:MAG: serine/threonine-protein kinase PknK, partial [Deltaproteobacteria bacterium]|nr:serine/threonine-protein kinase PknK [Deltaproteobacteria bacterium]